MNLMLLNLIILLANLMYSGFIISKILYKYGYFIKISAMYLNGYNQVFKLTLKWFKSYVKKFFCDHKLKVPNWTITENLYELNFTFNNESCKVLLQINNKVPNKVICADGLDVTQDVLPYLKLSPIQFTSELYGEPFKEFF